MSRRDAAMPGLPGCIVITGSTRGLGNALAEEFLRAGRKVVISGRTEDAVDRAAASLAPAASPTAEIAGTACDVRDPAAVDGLWRFAVERFGSVSVWINNAGVPQPYRFLRDLEPREFQTVVETNVLGMMYGSSRAVAGMLEAPADGPSTFRGAIYNMEGWGSNGRHMDRLNAYGMTKAAVRYFTRGLAREVRKTGLVVGALSPGMMVTDFLTEPMKDDPERMARSRKIFNIIADKPETVARYLAPRILSNRKNGASIVWGGTGKLLWRFASAPFVKRDLFADLGDGRP